MPGSPSVRFRSQATFMHNFPMGMRTIHGGDYLKSYEESWRHFFACIRQGTPLTATFDDGLRAAEAVNAAVESVTTCKLESVGKRGVSVLFSVVVPTFNRRQQLRGCLKALAEQTLLKRRSLRLSLSMMEGANLLSS